MSLDMNLINDCPDCGNQLSYNSKRCRCGWHLTSEQKTDLKQFNCQYVSNGVQCSESGTSSYVLRGKEWFCSKHANLLRDESFKRY